MPEDFEAETTELQEEQPTEAVEAESEAQPETEPQKPKTIPFERFQEVYADLKTARQGHQQLQNQVMDLQRQLFEATKPQKQAPPAPKIDPEIDEIINPSISSRLSPLEQRLARQEQLNAALYSERVAAKAWGYVEEAVPDLKELIPDIEAYLESIPQARANKITSDPDLVIQMAELVRAMKQAGKSVGVQVAKQDLKQRSKSDNGSASPAFSNAKIDWNALSEEEFAAHEAKVEAQRRRAGR